MTQYSSLADVYVADDLLLPDYVMKQAEKFGDRSAMVDAASSETYSFKDLVHGIRAFASAMMSRGMKRGDVLLVFSPNCIEYPVIFYGVIYIGGVITTANPMYTEGEIGKQLIDANVKYVCTNEEGLPKIKSRGNIKDIFILGRDSTDGYCRVDELIEEGKRLGPPDTAALTGRSREDTISICFSSGTTGLPKGVEISHRSFLYTIFQQRDPAVCHLDNNKDVTLGVLPFFHLWGMVAYMGLGLVSGITNIVFSRFTPETYIKAIEKYEATVLYVVPPILLKLAHSPLTASTNLSSLKHIICSAAPLTREIITELQKVMPPRVDLKQGFGMTESGLVMCGSNNSSVPMSSGILLPNVQAKVEDIVTRRTLGPNEQGEVLLKGPSLLKGYLNQPELTRNLYDDDNWLKTGDIGFYDDKGNWYITDRLKEIINYKGYNLCPTELEDILLQLPDVKDVAVVGVPDKEAIELPRAYVVKKEGSHVTEQDILTFVDDKLSKIKRLRGGVRFVEIIPKAPSGKIQRRLLRDQVRNESSSANYNVKTNVIIN